MLPPAVVNQGVTNQAGLTVLVINHGANPMQVFGSGTDTINDVAAATGVSQMQGSMTGVFLVLEAQEIGQRQSDPVRLCR